MTTTPPPPPYQAQTYYAAPDAEGSKRLGIVAFVAGIVILLLSPIASIVVGITLGPATQPGASFAQGFAAGQDSAKDPGGALVGLLLIAQVLFGSLIGCWALVQGIVAVRMRRGRTFGIIAIVLAGVAPILSFLVFAIVAGVVSAASH